MPGGQIRVFSREGSEEKEWGKFEQSEEWRKMAGKEGRREKKGKIGNRAKGENGELELQGQRRGLRRELQILG